MRFSVTSLASFTVYLSCNSRSRSQIRSHSFSHFISLFISPKPNKRSSQFSNSSHFLPNRHSFTDSHTHIHHNLLLSETIECDSMKFKFQTHLNNNPYASSTKQIYSNCVPLEQKRRPSIFHSHKPLCRSTTGMNSNLSRKKIKFQLWIIHFAPTVT